MAEATLTGTLVSRLTVKREFGLNCVYASASYTNAGALERISLSDSLRIRLIPLPNRARILDGWIKCGDVTTGYYNLGDSSASARFVASQSMTADQMTRFNVPAGIGHKVSLTVSDENSHDDLILSICDVTSASTTFCVAACVYYVVEDS